ncbi:hypothetical protein RB597_007026 [Gaeumannomyces tritici]
MDRENKKRKWEGNDDGPRACPQPPASEDAAQEPSGTKGDDRIAPKSQSRDDTYYKNLYAFEVNFDQLAVEDSAFAAVLKKPGQLDFTDPVSVVQLTKSTLKRDFGLHIELPADRLCPPVHNRHNYILWLKELLDSSSYDKPGGRLSGLDIGTGASCIYPLLGCTQRPWEFIATDLDEKSLAWAAENVKRNGLEHRIRLVRRHRPTDPLIPLDELGVDAVDFVMTNPPFYESPDELRHLAGNKARPPPSACTGAPVEMVCDGGEVGFVGRMLDESLALRGRARWYTAMLGKLSSLEVLVGRLRGGAGVAAAAAGGNYAVAEFVQGARTRRWAVAWTFGPMRPSQAAARGSVAELKWNKVPLPVEVEAEVAAVAVGDAGAAAEFLDGLMRSLDLESWDWDGRALRGVGRTRQNVWSRLWRRKQARKMAGKLTDADVADADAGKEAELPMFGFEVSVVVGLGGGFVLCRWREGHDQGIFTSICGFLKTKLEGIGKGAGVVS